ncbi:hypothetical protein ACVWYN_000208 [Pedobacter sp. UYP24]
MNFMMNATACVKHIALVFVAFFITTSSQAQNVDSTLERAKFDNRMIDLTIWANLEFSMPLGFEPSFVSEDLKWPCGDRHYTIDYNAVLKSKDSSIMVGIRITSKRPTKKPGKLALTDVDWKTNAKNNFTATYDKNENPPKYISKEILKGIWRTDFGVEYSRACTIPYKSKFPNHRIVTVGAKEFEFEVVYFYTDKMKNTNFVEFTSRILLPKKEMPEGG